MKLLSARQAAILDMLCDDCLSNKEIAARLEISEKAIEQHRAVLYNKANVSNMAQLCKWYWNKYRNIIS